MIEATSAGNLSQVHGNAGALPPGIATAAANDAAPEFTALFESALEPAAEANAPEDGGKKPKARRKRDAAPEAIDLVALGAIAALTPATGLPDVAATKPTADAQHTIAASSAGPARHAAQLAGGIQQDDADPAHGAPQAAAEPAAPAARTTPVAVQAGARASESSRTAEPFDRSPPPEASPVAGHAAAPQAASSASHPAALHVSPRLGSPGFDEAFAARVSVSVRAGIESASITLNPPELGPVEMQIRVSDGKANIVFAAEQALTREAISEALPRLREMLAAHGLELAGGSVGAQLPQRDPPSSAQAQADAPSPTAEEGASESETPLPRLAEPRLVDTFV
jgi:flagellar hook-length control protein FliK